MKATCALSATVTEIALNVVIAVKTTANGAAAMAFAPIVAEPGA